MSCTRKNILDGKRLVSNGPEVRNRWKQAVFEVLESVLGDVELGLRYVFCDVSVFNGFETPACRQVLKRHSVFYR